MGSEDTREKKTSDYLASNLSPHEEIQRRSADLSGTKGQTGWTDRVDKPERAGLAWGASEAS